MPAGRCWQEHCTSGSMTRQWKLPRNLYRNLKVTFDGTTGRAGNEKQTETGMGMGTGMGTGREREWEREREREQKWEREMGMGGGNVEQE